MAMDTNYETIRRPFTEYKYGCWASRCWISVTEISATMDWNPIPVHIWCTQYDARALNNIKSGCWASKCWTSVTDQRQISANLYGLEPDTGPHLVDTNDAQALNIKCGCWASRYWTSVTDQRQISANLYGLEPDTGPHLSTEYKMQLLCVQMLDFGDEPEANLCKSLWIGIRHRC